MQIFLSKADYKKFELAKLKGEEKRVLADAKALGKMTAPKSHGRTAEQRIETAFLIVSGKGAKGLEAYSVTAGPGSSEARTSLTAKGLVPHRVKEDPGTDYFMSPSQWQAYVKMGGVIE